MKELQYPFDAEAILSHKKKLRRQLLGDGTGRVCKKIAILGGYTTSNIRLMLELFLLDQGIEPSFYESEYNQYYQDAMFPNAELEAFAPDIIYICTCCRNVTALPSLRDAKDAVNELLESEYERFRAMWDRLEAVYHCPIIQNNMEMPYYRLLGNRDAWDVHGATNFLTRLNLRFYDYAADHEHFYICDVNYLSADYGLTAWSDPFYWHMYKYAVNVNAIPYLSFNVSNIIKSLLGKNKKGLVLDLDNTLWGGVIGDDGVENIELGPETSLGQAYSEFQRYLKAHRDLGILLNVDSKNEESNALAGLNHPDSELHPEDFIVIRANWDPKDRNFADIADSLGLLPESLVFVDDNPAERHIVTGQLPGVAAPEIGEVCEYIRNIDRNGFFEATVLSEDDFRRNEMYRSNAARRMQEKSFPDYESYLRSLGMKARILPFEPMYMGRIAQLTNKSNQFNLTTRRYTQSEIEALAADGSYLTMYGKLEDCFGDNGVVSVVIGHLEGDTCRIDLWLMSCRVLKREMESAMMDTLIRKCMKLGMRRILGVYYPTAKNGMVRSFYETMGFAPAGSDERGGTVWEYQVPGTYSDRQTVIDVTSDLNGPVDG